MNYCSDDSNRELTRCLIVDLCQRPLNSKVRVAGWVASIDSSLLISDSTGNVKAQLPENSTFREIDISEGDSVEIVGILKDRDLIDILDVRLHNKCLFAIPTAIRTPEMSYLGFRDSENIEIFKKMNLGAKVSREFLENKRFIETQVPLLWSSVQEYAEPEFFASHPSLSGKGYYILQSPEPLSMLAVVGGLDRTFQFARCIRSEGTIKDESKATEFTQLSISMSFASVLEGRDLFERLIAKIVNALTGLHLQLPFPVMTYEESIRMYGTDSPDFRFRHYLQPLVNPCHLGFSSGEFCALVIPFELSSAMIEQLTPILDRKLGSKYGISLFGSGEVINISGSLKFVTAAKHFLRDHSLNPPATVITYNGLHEEVQDVFLKLQKLIRQKLDPTPIPEYGFVWIKDFPFLLSNTRQIEDTLEGFHRSRSIFGRRIDSGSDNLLPTVELQDLVLNGIEIGGVGEREHNPERFVRNLEIAGLHNGEERYKFYLDALKCGAPPMLNIALGWDRLMWLILKTRSLRDVMFLPKDSTGACPVGNLPTIVNR